MWFKSDFLFIYLFIYLFLDNSKWDYYLAISKVMARWNKRSTAAAGSKTYQHKSWKETYDSQLPHRERRVTWGWFEIHKNRRKKKKEAEANLLSRRYCLKQSVTFVPSSPPAEHLQKFSLHTWEVKVSLLCTRKIWQSALFNVFALSVKIKNLPLGEKKI